MIGDAVMGASNDTTDNRAGTITGAWFGGDGDDNCLGHLNSTVAGTIYGSAGNDTPAGHAGDDEVQGDAGNEPISGGTGEDVFVFQSTGETPVDLTGQA